MINFDKIFNNLNKQIDCIMNSITINDESFIVSGKSIVVKNGTVYVNGEKIKEGLSGDVKIIFTGDLADLDCTSAVINGNVNGDVDCTSANISGNVGGDVDGTNINCGDVGRDVGGTIVNCNNVKGNIKAVKVKHKNNINI
jgi:hypothetical protein